MVKGKVFIVNQRGKNIQRHLKETRAEEERKQTGHSQVFLQGKGGEQERAREREKRTSTRIKSQESLTESVMHRALLW